MRHIRGCVEILTNPKITAGNRISSLPSIPPPPQYPGVGRNDPCPCGSGRKFKKCCGAG